MTFPTPEEVRAQLRKLCEFPKFRGAKIRKLLEFLVAERLRDPTVTHTVRSIGVAMQDEMTEDDYGKFGYNRTKGNLAHLRNRLNEYYNSNLGSRDRVIIKLNPGSFTPEIGYNPLTAADSLYLDPLVERLILRAKTAIDARTLRGSWRAIRYYEQLPMSMGNPRHTANMVFLPMALAATMPSMVIATEPLFEIARQQIGAAGVEPWEWTFSEACAAACFEHKWSEAANLFEVAASNSQQEAKYYWWYTAILASLNRMPEAVHILQSAVQHFNRTSLATRCDLAVLQVMERRFDDAEEVLLSSLDFVAPENPLLVQGLALLYEAQDRLQEAVTPVMRLMHHTEQRLQESAIRNGEPVEDAIWRADWALFLNGMIALLAGRQGADQIAAQLVETLLEMKAKRDKTSSVEIALALIGVGRLEDAVKWLHTAAFDEHDPFAMWFHIFPPLRHLRTTPSFHALLEKLGLPPA